MKLIVFASLICFSLAYSNTPIQYHIQTDTGPNRYFRFQTYNGQYRKEKRFDDGTVIGTYGWVDANNYLRLYNYVADENGYRVVSFKKRKVNSPSVKVNPDFNRMKPALRHQPQVHTRFGMKNDNSLEDDSITKYNQRNPEFVNSKMHTKLQPNYQNSLHGQTSESEEDNLLEGNVSSEDIQTSPDPINSKIHNKLQTNYFKNQQRQTYVSEEDSSIEENIVSDHQQSSSEFINSKMHPKLRQRQTYSNTYKQRDLHNEDDTSIVGTKLSQRRKNAPEFVNSKMHPKLRPVYASSQQRQSPIRESGKSNKRSRGNSEFINSKIHSKLRQSYSNNKRNNNQRNSYVVKRRKPTNQRKKSANNRRMQTSQSKQVKSMTVPEEFQMNEPGGKITIDFDLGNQYRKEKIYPDGRVIGEHGYVDPLGILRKTYYKSGPGGLKQKKISYWVGRRSANS